jgi:hypothetical protein
MSVDSTSISLLRRLRESDAELDWLRFSNLYAPLVFCWGRGQGLDATDAADLVQEVMTKLGVKLREFEYDPKRTLGCASRPPGFVVGRLRSPMHILHGPILAT